MATANLAQDLAAWAAGNDIATLMVFGVDVIFAIRRDGEQATIPRQFNDAVWGLDLLKAVQEAYQALGNSPDSSGPLDLAINFEAGILPGDPGFELSEPPQAESTAPASELIIEGTLDEQPTPPKPPETARADPAVAVHPRDSASSAPACLQSVSNHLQHPA